MTSAVATVTVIDFLSRLKWLDGRALLPTIEPYRRRIFEQFFALDDAGTPRVNLGLFGRAKKNWKSTDAMLACLYALLQDSPWGSQVYVVANDEDQADDNLDLVKKIVKANPWLNDLLLLKAKIVERKDGGGFMKHLPGQSAITEHGKTYRFKADDEIHGYRNWDLLEALAPDPTRRDAQQWITSYATLFHKPGVPLFDLLQQAKAGTDPRMLVSWYAADWCTDPDFAWRPPEHRANPSMASWGNPSYLEQQRRRLPTHKFNRLHLNLPGSPEGTAYQAERVMDAVQRGVQVRPRLDGVRHVAFVDMSGGSADDAVLAIAHRDGDDRGVLDRLVDQGQRPPFDPSAAVERFVPVLREYGCTALELDRYAGNTFKAQFEKAGFRCDVASQSKSEIYEDCEVPLNGRRLVLIDHQVLEQQLLGLAWRGGKIDHAPGEHDDFANAAAGALMRAIGGGSGRGGRMVPLGGL
jgi:hypothetical protein